MTTGVDLPARPPYPGGSDRHMPIVPHVLIVGERTTRYAPPSLTRATTIYDTPTTVRVQLPTGAQETQQQHKVWAVPDDAAWNEIEAAVAVFGARLAALADVLRRLGRYADRLAPFQGAATTPNPLCASVAQIDDPDRTGTTWWLTSWYVPGLRRTPIQRHTAKMLSNDGTGGYVFSQQDCFVLDDDADWEQVCAAHTAAQDAATAVEQLLVRMGTYGEALDGRHAARVAAAASPPESGPGAAAPVRRGKGLALSVAPTSDLPAGALSDELQDIARRYVAARRKTGEGLLEAAEAMAEARASARHGEWGLFLAATGTSESTARRLIDIDMEARQNALYRQKILDGWLGASAAALLAQSEAPLTVLERLLAEVPPETPPGVAEVHAAQAAVSGKSTKLADLDHTSRPSADDDVPAPFAEVARLLHGGLHQEAYRAARHLNANEDHALAMAAVDAAVEGRPLDDALAFLWAAPADLVTQQHPTGCRRVLALQRSGVLALTPAWTTPTPDQPSTIWPEHFTITHIPSGHAVAGVVLTGRAKADAVFAALAALDWPAGPLAALPAPLAEQVAGICGLTYPDAESYQAAGARAHALGRRLNRRLVDNVGGPPYTLSFPGEGMHGQEVFARWADLIARLDALETPAAPAPAPPTLEPAFDAAAWAQRASAVGARLLIYRQGYVLDEPGQDEACGTPYAAGQEAALIDELAIVEARLQAGCADATDRAALECIGSRADALGAIALGTRAGEALALAQEPAPALPAGWTWSDDVPRPLYAARRFDGAACRSSPDQAEAAQNAAWTERRHPAITIETEWRSLVTRAAALPDGSLICDPATHDVVLATYGFADLRTTDRAELLAELHRRELALAPTPPEFGDYATRARTLGGSLGRDGTGAYVLLEPDGTRSRYPQWLSVIARIRALEAGATVASVIAADAANPLTRLPAHERAYARAEQLIAGLLAEDTLDDETALLLCQLLDLGDDVDDPREALWEALTARAEQRLAVLAAVPR